LPETSHAGKGMGLNSALTRRGISIVLLIVVISIVVAAFALRSIRYTARTHAASMLTQMVDSTYSVMQFWEARQRTEVEDWAKVPELVNLTGKLVQAGHSPAALLKHPAQAALRRLLAPEMREHGYDGYFLIDPDHVSIASMRGSSLGDLNPLSGRAAELGGKSSGRGILQRVFTGETVLSLPQPSDLPPVNSQGKQPGGMATMFVVAPVRDAAGRVLAALAFRIKPEGDFSHLAMMGQGAKGAETYLFNGEGRMLTGSRFEADLFRSGLLKPGQSSILNLRLLDPGENLMEEGSGLPENYADRALTRMAAEAVQGKSGMNLDGYRDYRGVPVVGAWRWYPAKGYGVAAEMDVDEAYGMFGSMRAMLFGILLGMILVFMLMVFLMELLNRRAADALSISEARYRQLFNLIPDAIAVHREGSIAYCNPAAVKMFAAQSADDLLGRSMPDLVHQDDRRRVTERISQAMVADGSDTLEEGRLLRMDGTSFMAEIEGCRFADSDGQDAVLVVARDISARKQAEEERERLRIAVEQTAEGIHIADAQGKIVYANPAAAHITGRPLAELIGMYAAESRGGEVNDELHQKIVARMKAGEAWSGELTLLRPDGVKRTVERRISPVMLEGETHYHVSVDRDITEERRHQEQMEHTQRLESLGVLAGGIAHDFNNILAAIMGNASMATKKFGDNTDAVKHLKRIEDASQRAAELCRQMLAYSGKGRFVVRPVNLSLMLQDISKLLEVSITKHAQLEIELAPDLPAVQADATQLQQVFMNLVINASDAIGECNGRIVLRTGQIQAGIGDFEQTYTGEILPAGHYVFLEVSDNGCGMSEETRKKLFDPFYTTKFTGRGLGMSAVLGIVRGHHGAILVDSKEGEGSSFRVLLPVVGDMVGEGVEKEDEGIDWCPTGTVLVVDDESVVRETASMMLEEMGFQTLQAEDGEEGLEVYRRNRNEIALVLLDMTMPRMDGSTCFARLREMNPDVHVVLSSGYNEQDATNTFADDDLAGFVQKPYRLATLRAKLREALEG